MKVEGVVFLFRGGPLRGAGCAGGVRGGSLWEGGRRAGGRRVPPPVRGRDSATPVSRSCRWSVVSSSTGDYSVDRAGVLLPHAVRRWERGGV